MKQLILIAVMLAGASFAQAHEFVCKSGNVARMISVEHDVPGQEVPCAVKYVKPDQGTTDYPWRATNTLGYCAEKADLLANRLRDAGWTCDRTDDEADQEG